MKYFVIVLIDLVICFIITVNLTSVLYFNYVNLCNVILYKLDNIAKMDNRVLE